MKKELINPFFSFFYLIKEKCYRGGSFILIIQNEEEVDDPINEE
jgi:hypothetical protein